MTASSRAAVLVVLVVLAGLVTALGLLAPTRASASCTSTPRVSAYPFTGTVVSVANRSRTATVRTDDGRTVTVIGSNADRPEAATSVDRTYQVGVRYEFHPINESSPFRDNACTATHRVPAATGSSGRRAPVAERPTGRYLNWWLGGTAAVVGTGAAAGLWLLGIRIRRRASAR